MRYLRASSMMLAVFMAMCLFAAPVIAATASTPDLPLASEAVVLMDYHTGKVLYEKNAHVPLPPASVTKIMTLALALEALHAGKVNLDTLIPTSERAASMGGTQIWLEPGEQRPFQELLYAIAVGSANDASVAVAEYLGGCESGFVTQMNAKARSLGMKNTHFANPSGLPPSETGSTEKHVSSAYDLAVLSRYALGLPMFLELVSTWGPVVMRPEGKRQPELWTFNKMMKQYRGMDGIKTGMTGEAGFCLAATAVRDNLRLIAVTLKASTSKVRNDDVARLLDFGFGQLRGIKVASQNQKVGEIAVQKGRVAKVAVAPAHDAIVSVGRTEKAEPSTEIVVTSPLTAPVRKGQMVGELVIKVNGTEVTRVPLLAMEEVPRGSLLQIMLQTVKRVSMPGK